MIKSETEIKPGDKVIVINRDEKCLQESQRNFGGWNKSMEECFCAPSEVIKVSGNILEVNSPSGKNYKFNREIICKCDSSMVVVIDSESVIKKYHSGKELDIAMEHKGRIGSIKTRHNNGIYEVIVNGTTTTTISINKKCLNSLLVHQPLTVGSMKTVTSDLNRFQELQIDHGGWCDLMKFILGQKVKISALSESGDCLVEYEGMQWLINPENFQDINPKVIELCEGDLVRISSDLEQSKILQNQHGGWSDVKQNVMGQVGEVQQILPDGNIMIKINKLELSYNPKLLTKYSTDDEVKVTNDESQLKQLQKGHGEYMEPMKMLLGKKVIRKYIFPDCDLRVKTSIGEITLNSNCVTKINSGDINCNDAIDQVAGQFKVGDKVRIESNESRVKTLQVNHGGWVEQMEKFLGKASVVKRNLKDDVVQVSIGRMEFAFNTQLLTKLSSDEEKKEMFPGDVVKVTNDESQLKQLQKGHCEYNILMKQLLGEEVTIKYIFPDGDLRVKTSIGGITLNSKCVTKIRSGDLDSDDDVDPGELLRAHMMKAMMLDPMKMMAKMFTGGLDDSDYENSSLNNSHSDEAKQIILAIKHGDSDNIRQHIDKIDVNAVIKDETRFIHFAVIKRQENIIKLFIQRECDLNVKDKDGDTPLTIAAKLKCESISDILIVYGADPNIANKKLRTPAMYAAKHGNLDILQSLNKYNKVDWNKQDNSGRTSLHFAVEKDKKEAVKFILSNPGVDITLVNEKGFNPIILSVYRGNVECLEEILNKVGSKNIDKHKDDGIAAIHVAAINNHYKCIEVLHQFKADLNLRTTKKQTALHVAISQLHLKSVETLIALSADVNIPDRYGDTPLHDAINKYNKLALESIAQSQPFEILGGLISEFFRIEGSDKPEKIVMVLVKNGANLNIMNNKGLTALDICLNSTLKAKILSVQNNHVPVQKSKTEQENIEMQLKKQIEELQTKVEELKYDKMCKLCCDRDVDSILDCGHSNCSTCVENIIVCSYCQKPIGQIVKRYN